MTVNISVKENRPRMSSLSDFRFLVVSVNIKITQSEKLYHERISMYMIIRRKYKAIYALNRYLFDMQLGISKIMIVKSAEV